MFAATFSTPPEPPSNATESASQVGRVNRSCCLALLVVLAHTPASLNSHITNPTLQLCSLATSLWLICIINVLINELVIGELELKSALFLI